MERFSRQAEVELPAVPEIYSNIQSSDNNLVMIDGEVKEWPAVRYSPSYTLDQFVNAAQGYEHGVRFNFGGNFNGKLYFGFIKRSENSTSLPVSYREAVNINDGRAEVSITEMFSGKYDMVDGQQKGISELAYRVLDEKGRIIYEGRLVIEGRGPFKVVPAIVEGPFINKVTHNQAVVSFSTSKPVICKLAVNGLILDSKARQLHHEIAVENLQPDSSYVYHLLCGDYKFTSSFRTAPLPGSRQAFTFGFTSGSRTGKSGGEGDVYGVKAYMMKRMAAYAAFRKLDFWQFTGDLIDGYLQHPGETRLQYANWKRTVEPFAHQTPVFVGTGDHETVSMNFARTDGEYGAAVDRFPFDTHSSEAVFGSEFVNFENGPRSEDGAWYDPVMKKGAPMNFPSYKENVYSYTWDNVAMIVLNSNYWLAPDHKFIPITSGNPHSYIMDNQLAWLKEELEMLEQDENVDHVFVTLHSAAFPSGGNDGNDMWYGGTNDVRPYIAGEAHQKGIIERRDEFLDVVINKSNKTVALLCGDEHNYSRMLINDSMPRYPEGYDKPKLTLERELWQITNGNSGTPDYAQQKLPWGDFVQVSSTQNALALFHVDGKHIKLEVVNPETFHKVEEFRLR